MNIFEMLGRLFAENQILGQEIARLKAEIQEFKAGQDKIAEKTE